MQMTPKAGHAVAALVDLARLGGTRHVSLHSIAARRQISLSYLEHLFARLRRHGLVRALRGPGGGYLLARPAAAISVADIVDAVGAGTAPAFDHPMPLAGGISPEAAVAESLWRCADAHLLDALRSVDLQSLVDAAGGAPDAAAVQAPPRSPVHPREKSLAAPPRRAVASVFDLAESL